MGVRVESRVKGVMEVEGEAGARGVVVLGLEFKVNVQGGLGRWLRRRDRGNGRTTVVRKWCFFGH